MIFLCSIQGINVGCSAENERTRVDSVQPPQSDTELIESDPDVSEEANEPTITLFLDSPDGIYLYVATSRGGCECYVELCTDVRSEMKELAASYEESVHSRLIFEPEDADEVQGLRDFTYLWGLPIVALVDVKKGEGTIIYAKNGFFNVETVVAELDGAIDVRIHAGV